MPQAIVVGYNDNLQLGTGWHSVQQGPGGVACRWTSACAEFRIEAADISQVARVLAFGSGTELPSGLSLFLGQKRLFYDRKALEGTGWRIIELPLPFNGPGSFSLRTERENEAGQLISATFVPHLVLGNGDYRELGALVAAIYVR